MGCSPPSSEPWRRALLSGALHLGLQVSQAQLEAYQVHLDLLLAHNPRAGLTTITDPAEIAVKHYLDSLTCLLLPEVDLGGRVADVGSGAGFPGLVLAIARPGGRYTLIESARKRAAFLEEAVGTLGLQEVSVIPARAEEVGRMPEHRENYDIVLSRAVAPLPVLLEYGLPLARPGGHFLAYKGPDADREIARSAAALAALGGRLARTHHLSLPDHMGQRCLILVEKTASTPARYPRRPGTPARRPL